MTTLHVAARALRSRAARHGLLLPLMLAAGGCSGLRMLENALLLGPLGVWTEPAPGVYRDAAPPQAPVSPDEAWRLLASGRYARALSRFGEAVERRPEDGTPVIGCALTVASMGDLGCAIGSMRWALRHDPAALARVPVTPQLRKRLQALVPRYRSWLHGGASDHDPLLMLSVLHHLLGDHDRARAAAQRAEALGDRSSAAVNLRKIVAPPAPSAPAPGSLPVPPASSPPAPAAAPPVGEVAAVAVPAADAGTKAEAAPAPTVPVDYDRLREELLAMSDTLDRFTRKLLKAVEEGANAAD